MKMFINVALQADVLSLILMQQSKAQLLFITEYFKVTVLLNTNQMIYMNRYVASSSYFLTTVMYNRESSAVYCLFY